MTRRLAFSCPDTNIVVLTSIDLGMLSQDKAASLPCEINSPCGAEHTFQAYEALTFAKSPSSQSPAAYWRGYPAQPEPPVPA
jgi:hypothetical protein